jgi:hypothetical protein
MGKISKADLARRIGRKPEQISRWLGAAGNWTIDTVSDLLLGMSAEPELSVGPLIYTIPSNLVGSPQPEPPALGTMVSSAGKGTVVPIHHRSGWEDALKGAEVKPPQSSSVAARFG